MGRGTYLGGSTVIGPGSGWFSAGVRKKVTQATDVDAHKRKKPKKSTARKKAAKSAAKIKSSNKPANAPRTKAVPPPTGNGLTIPERIVRAETMVRKIEAEIAQAEQRLQKQRKQLVVAKAQLESAQNLPRRSAIGIALQRAKDNAANLSIRDE